MTVTATAAEKKSLQGADVGVKTGSGAVWPAVDAPAVAAAAAGLVLIVGEAGDRAIPAGKGG